MSFFSRKKPKESKYSRLICGAATKMGIHRSTDGLTFDEFGELVDAIVDRIIALEAKASDK